MENSPMTVIVVLRLLHVVYTGALESKHQVCLSTMNRTTPETANSSNMFPHLNDCHSHRPLNPMRWHYSLGSGHFQPIFDICPGQILAKSASVVTKWSHTNEDMNWLESALKERVTYGIVPGWKTDVVSSTNAVPLVTFLKRLYGYSLPPCSGPIGP